MKIVEGHNKESFNRDVINAWNATSKSLLERSFFNFAIDLQWKKLPLITALIYLSKNNDELKITPVFDLFAVNFIP